MVFLQADIFVMKYKYFLSFSLLSAIFFIASCSKDEDVPRLDTQKISLIQKHTWILDSTNTITPTYSIVQPEVPSSLYRFLADTMLINYHGTQLITYGVVYEDPNKIYFWLPGEMKDINEYIIIETVDNVKLKVKEVDVTSQRTRVRYFHAQ